MSTVADTITEWLARIGADGLCNSDAQCGCGEKDGGLFPCDGIQKSCVPAQLRIATDTGETYDVGDRVFFPMKVTP